MDAAAPVVQPPVRPLEGSLKPLVLPELAVKVALGGKVHEKQDQVELTFEGEVTIMHSSDYALVARAAKRLQRERLPLVRARNVSAILELAGYAHQFVCQEIFAPGLKKVLYLPSPVKANGFWRCAVPSISMNSRGRVLAHLAASVKTARACLPYDVIVFQLGHDPATFQIAKTFKTEMGKKLIFEMDDDMFAQETWHGAYELYQSQRVRDELKAMLTLADAVTVTTDYLKERYGPFTRRVEVIPNHLPLANWPKTEPHGTGEFRVLWAGSPSHFGDLQMVADALTRFAREHSDVRLIFFGREPVGLAEDINGQVTRIPWCEFEEYPVKLAAVKADVAIAPLADVPFNKAKSNLKLLEYWGCGYPVIASAVGPYFETARQTGCRGLRTCRDATDWFNDLQLLRIHPQRREQLAREGREIVCQYDMDQHAAEIEEFFLSV